MYKLDTDCAIQGHTELTSLTALMTLIEHRWLTNGFSGACSVRMASFNHSEITGVLRDRLINSTGEQSTLLEL